MATYLQIVQQVADESGTLSGSTISTLSGIAGRGKRMKQWVTDAWSEIQTEQRSWRWLDSDFSGTTLSGTRQYSAAGMGISSRFGHWKWTSTDWTENAFTVYETSKGQSDEGHLQYVPWNLYRRIYLVGSNAALTGKPTRFSIAPNNRIDLHPIPDDDFTIRGIYQKAPQTLSVDDDTPECPSQYHEAIKWLALVKLAVFDLVAADAYLSFYQRAMHNLRIDQMPRFEPAEPLA